MNAGLLYFGAPECQLSMPRGLFHFGDYTLDCDRFELLRAGLPVKLEKLPMELLILLVERGSQLVARQEIVERLWGKDVYVDSEHGINTAIRKIRTALREDAEEPRFVQTVVGKGYRFVAELATEKPESAEPSHEPKAAVPAGARTAERRGLWLAASTAVVLLFVGAGMLALNVGGIRSRPAAGAQPVIRSIAVLPLANLSGDASQEYFADGLTDELITMLATNTSLRVVSRTSSMRYKGVNRPVHDIAQELGTDGILEGSISRSANRIHLTVQLVRAQNDAHIWAQSYDRDLSDTLSLLSELSWTIAREVKVATSPQAEPQRKVNPEAHIAYLRGLDLWFNSDYGKAQDFYEEAIHLQPDYAAAWSGLADVYIAEARGGIAPSQEFRGKAQAAARKSLELDASLGEAHHAMAAEQYFLEWNWQAAEAESLRDVELNRNSSEAHHLRSYILETLNRPKEALEEQSLASELDPDIRPFALGWAFLRLRQYHAAAKELRSCLEAHPHNVFSHYLLADAYHFAGMEKQSVDEYAEIYRSDNDTDAVEAIQREFQRGGAHAVALWQLNRWKKSVGRGYANPYELAERYSRAGRKDDALRALENAYKEKSAMMVWLQLEPDFDELHSEDRYQVLVKKMGLPAM